MPDLRDNPIIRRFLVDPILTFLGGVVLLLTGGVFLATVSRTTSFWDCGEFLACSNILGIPHPPGTPLFILIGRVFAMMPLSGDIAHRINLISPLSSAAAATIAFFVMARLITSWYSDRYPDPTLDWGARLSIYAGSFCGALLFAFGTTNWSNSVEAEVYGLSMFLMISLVWLALIWAQKRDEPGSDRYLIAIAFLAFLSIGIHMTVFLILPPIFLMVVILSPRHRTDWRLWLTMMSLVLVTSKLLLFLWSVTALLALGGCLAAYKRWGPFGLLWTIAVLGGGILWAATQGEAWPIFVTTLVWAMGIMPWVVRSASWRLSFLLLLVSLLGYSAHLYIPIRAQHNPSINENDPKSWMAFRGFLERKQYGDESMFQRAMKRRGEWANQLGQHARMGFWGFFDRQYGFNDRWFLPIFALGMAGVIYLIRKRSVYGVVFFSALLLCTIGLVWYMNFADGTRYDPVRQDAYLEVRDRDYFFTPGFVLFGMAIGLGGAALIRSLASGSLLWPAFGALVVAALPFRALQANYVPNDRSNNFLAYDYAYNLLISADENAMFFTNGDNDTFPLWAAQEVYGIRRDVRVVNLSLLNTYWYIKQLKYLRNVPIDLSEAEIDKLIHYRTPDGKTVRIQDQMMDEILASNRGTQTINLSVTVPESSRRYRGQSLDSNLVIIGMAYRLTPEKQALRTDLPRLVDLIWNKFLYRGVTDPSVYKDENARRMVDNYSSGFFFAAEEYRRLGDNDACLRQMKRAMELGPNQWESFVYLAQLYVDLKSPDSLESLYAQSKVLAVDWERAATSIGYSFRRLGLDDRAEQILLEVLAKSPTHEPAFRTLVQMYYTKRQYPTLLGLMERWCGDNPRDAQTRSMLDSVRVLARNFPSAGGGTAGQP